jgi:uncharacterized membrane protein
MDEKIEAGLGTIVAGGVMTALGGVAAVTFGVLPTVLIGVGAVVLTLGIYSEVRKPQPAA